MSVDTRGPPAEKKAGGSHHRSNRINRPSPREMVYGLYALSPGTGFVAPVARKTRQHLSSLASAPGRQDHTTSPSAHCRSPAC